MRILSKAVWEVAGRWCDDGVEGGGEEEWIPGDIKVKMKGLAAGNEGESTCTHSCLVWLSQWLCSSLKAAEQLEPMLNFEYDKVGGIEIDELG